MKREKPHLQVLGMSTRDEIAIQILVSANTGNVTYTRHLGCTTKATDDLVGKSRHWYKSCHRMFTSRINSIEKGAVSLFLFIVTVICKHSS